jgi:hypothetical protein
MIYFQEADSYLGLFFFFLNIKRKRSAKWLFFLVLAYVSAINELKTARSFKNKDLFI